MAQVSILVPTPGYLTHMLFIPLSPYTYGAFHLRSCIGAKFIIAFDAPISARRHEGEEKADFLVDYRRSWNCGSHKIKLQFLVIRTELFLRFGDNWAESSPSLLSYYFQQLYCNYHFWILYIASILAVRRPQLIDGSMPFMRPDRPK